MFTTRVNDVDELRKLKRTLEHISLKLATGLTLDSALRGHHHQSLRVCSSLAKQWIWLRDLIHSGRVPPKKGIDAFVILVDTHHLCLSESKKRGLNAKIQSRV